MLLCAVLITYESSGLLYPRESESREIRLLDGFWNFRADYSPDRDAGFIEEWFNSPLSQVKEDGYIITKYGST